MDATIELRIREQYARRHLPRGMGKKLEGGIVRLVHLPFDDPLVAQIGEAQRQREGDHNAFYGWEIWRRYSEDELLSAELLLVLRGSLPCFDATGEECGTVYDDGVACPLCGAARAMVGNLVLDLTRVPTKALIAKTFVNEIIVERKLKELIEGSMATGVEFPPVIPKPAKEDLADKWYSPVVVSRPVRIIQPTVVGDDPFRNTNGEHACPQGDTLGLALVSELHINRVDWDGSDVVCTQECIGLRRGLYHPRPLMLISQRLYRLLKDNGVGGFRVEVVHLG